MENLKHVMTFEQFSVKETEEVNEGVGEFITNVLDPRKKSIENFFAKNPKDDKKAGDLLVSLFSRSLTNFPARKEEVLSLSLEDKAELLQKTLAVLNDKKGGNLKLFKNPKENKYEVGSVGLSAHTGGGKNG